MRLVAARALRPDLTLCMNKLFINTGCKRLQTKSPETPRAARKISSELDDSAPPLLTNLIICRSEKT